MKNLTLFSIETRFKDRFYCCLESLKGNAKFLLVFLLFMGSFTQGVSAQGTLVPACNLTGPLEACAVLDPVNDTSGDFVINITVARSGTPNLGVNPLTLASDGTFNNNFAYTFVSNSSGAFIRSYGTVNYNSTLNSTTQALVVCPGSGTPEFNLQLNVTNTSSSPSNTFCECSKSVSVSKVAATSSYAPILCYGQLTTLTAVGSFSDVGLYTYTLLPNAAFPLGVQNTTGIFPNLPGSVAGITYTVNVESAEGCTTVTSQTITQPASNPVVLTCPTETTTAACLTQGAVDSAFNAWLLTFSATGGTNRTVTRSPLNPTAPSACGGTITVTWTATENCTQEPVTCSSTFTVPAPLQVVLTCAVTKTTTACQTQAAVNSDFAAWLATASATGGCNGNLTNNNQGAPLACGGTTTVTFTFTSTCTPFTTTCQATYTVPAAPEVALTCPTNKTTTACQTQAAIDLDYAAWLATASASGGCNGGLTNNSQGAPSACGGSRTVTFTYTSTCAPLSSTCQATYTVPAPATVSLTPPQNQTTAACLTQAAVNDLFAAWLASASATGGCNGNLTNNSETPPSACGGTRTVVFTYTSTCEPFTSTGTATFTVPTPATVSLTPPQNQTTAACLTQAAVNDLFAAWLASASATGGCNGNLTNNSETPPSACGGTRTVVFTYTSTCEPFTSTGTATFTVPTPATVSLTPPQNQTTAACLTQAAVNDLYAAWLATASATGGCNGNLTNNSETPPSACGGTRTVVFTYTSTCEPFTSTGTATFTVPTPATVSLTPPQNQTTAACLTQAAVNDLYAAWLATASATGGCNGNLTNNSETPPSACGGTRTVVFTYTSTCEPFTSTGTATFTVPTPATVSLTPPQNQTTAACLTQAAVNDLYAAWLATASATGGCNGNLTNNSETPPSACGGTRTVVFTYTSTCEPFTSTGTATFTVPTPALLVVNAPANSSATYTDQASVNTAFNLWLAGFNYSGGCNPSGSYGQPTPPPYCGGATTVTLIVNDYCHEPVTVSATFSTNGPTVVTVNIPANSTTSACAYANQAAADAAFTAWLNLFSVSGGINPQGTFNGTPAAPPYCGGTTTVTYVVTDSCYETTTHVGTFTINAGTPVDVTGPAISSNASCQYADQAAVNAAFALWLAQFSVTNTGCNASTNNQGTFDITDYQIPSVCGGTVTLTYSYADNCTQDSATSSFTVTPSTPVVVNGPASETHASCDYATQAQADAAYQAWLLGFTVSGGCSPTGTFGEGGAPAAPSYCGGERSVTYNGYDRCHQQVSVTRTFTITPSAPVTVSGPASETHSSCAYADQTAVNAAYAAWLLQFTVSGGCSPSGSFGEGGAQAAPALCGGEVTVTYSGSDRCHQAVTITRTFTVTAPAPVVVNAANNATYSACSFANQAAADLAFATWLTNITVSGGCAPVVTAQGQPVAPPVCGGSVCVTFLVTDKCYTGSVTQKFTITAAPLVVITQPENSTTASCDYATQAAADTAFAAWLAQFTVTGGCSPHGSFGEGGLPTAPSYCGGDRVVTFTVTDKCYQGAPVTRTFTITPSAPVTVSGPANATHASCDYATQAAADSAYAAWLLEFTVSGGCSPTGTFGEGGAPAAPSYCGGERSVTYSGYDRCHQPVSITRTFTITPSAPVTVSGPANSSTAACTYANQAAVNTAYAAWLAQFTVSGGCSPTGTFGEGGAPSAPSYCGGTVSVTYSGSDRCHQPVSITRTFTVATPTEVTFTCGNDFTLPACSTQAQLNSAYAAFLASTTASGGCVNGTLTNNGAGHAPSLCGGYTDVTWTYTVTGCGTSRTCTKRFTVAAPAPVVLTCATAFTLPACSTQAQLNAAWTAFLNSTTATGGCNGVLTRTSCSAPSLCGGYVDVTWTYTVSTCGQQSGCGTGNSVSCTKRFTVAAPAPAVITCASNYTLPACSTQAQLNTAWTAFLNSATATGGCNGVLTRTSCSAPSLCGGYVDVTWTYTIASCGQQSGCGSSNSVSCTKRFTVAAPAPVVITCASNFTLPACSTQAQLNTAWTAFLNSTTATGGCGGVLTNNGTTAPSLCGGYKDVTWTYTVASCGQQSGCGSSNTATCTKRFTVAAPSQVVFNCGADKTVAACSSQAQVNSAWTTFLASTTASGGCGGVLTNNAPAAAPSVCGGYVDVTWTYTVASCGQQSGCGNGSLTCTKRFTVVGTTPVVFTCGTDVTVPACSSQTTVNNAWNAFLASTTASGGCGGTFSRTSASTPSSCGGSVNVTWTYCTTACGGQSSTQTCTRTFTVAAPAQVVLTPGQNYTLAACSTQAQLNTAWTAFLNSTTASGGCSGVLTRTSCSAPSLCGGYVDVTWTYTVATCGQSSGCGSSNTGTQSQSITRRFTVAAPAPLTFNAGNNITFPACSTQAQLNTAWTSFLNSVTVTGGCNATLTRTSCSAPSLCGGYVDVTWTATTASCGQQSGCGSGNSQSITRRFTVSAPSQVSFNCGANVTVSGSSTQAQITTAWNTFLNSTTASGGCNATLTRTTPAMPTTCGQYADVTWTYTVGSCGQQSGCGSSNQMTCTKRFTIGGGSTSVTITVNNVTVPSCKTQAQVNALWASFLTSATVSGGGTLTNNGASRTIPSACGGYADVTWTYTGSGCGQTVVTCGGQTTTVSNTYTVTRRFTVTAGGGVDVSGPSNFTKANNYYSSQYAVNNAFAAWLCQFTTVSNGCGSTAVFSGSPRVAPSWSNGGSVTVTYSITGNCNSDSVCATFTITDSGNCKVVAQVKEPMTAKAYPNPFSENFNLDMTTSSVEKVGVAIYDMTGKLIEQREVNANEVSGLQIGDRFAAGVYNVIVTQGSEVKTLRVIKR